MRSITWNRFPIKNLWLIPCFFDFWSEVTWTIYNVSRFHLGGSELCLGAKPTKAPRGDGTDQGYEKCKASKKKKRKDLAVLAKRPPLNRFF